MNSPKEKAKELIDKFYQTFPLTMDVITTKGDLSWKYDNWKQAIECALIAVNEIMLAIPDASDDDSPYNHELKYWQEVKTEIENL